MELLHRRERRTHHDPNLRLHAPKPNAGDSDVCDSIQPSFFLKGTDFAALA
jgi:hypothetical protein